MTSSIQDDSLNLSAQIDCNGVRFADIRAVIFDKDGTLAQVDAFLSLLGQLRADQLASTIPGIETAVLDSFGLKQGLDPTGLLAVASRSENIIAIAAHVAATERGWLESLARVEAAFLEAEQKLPLKAPLTPLVPGTLDLLSRLQAAQLELGLLSSDTQGNVESWVETYQLESYFSYLQGVSEALPSKTHPHFLAQACRSMQVDPAVVLVIGDSAADRIMATNAAGFIGVTGGWSRPFEIVSPEPFLKPHAAAVGLEQINVVR
ncbi:MAG: HAD family hydrolase [Cyanobacteria bacterium P01_D01_bin.44]